MEQNSDFIVKALSLQDFLIKHPMKHEDLARLLGVCVDAVNSWSCGRRTPRPQILTHLATLDERFIENPLMREKFVLESCFSQGETRSANKSAEPPNALSAIKSVPCTVY